MVAKITEPKNFLKAFRYNENKLKEGVAEFIGAGNFLKIPEQLSTAEKIQRFKQLIQLNKRVEYNTLHISLNFEPSEKFSKAKLLEISEAYMEKIGFGDQPYLVYQHHDTDHCHIHIVTTTIREDGNSININNIGQNQSSDARRAIEIEFDLVRAEGRKKGKSKEIESQKGQSAQLSKSGTKSYITNKLEKVLNEYKFGSLHELNAILSISKIRADTGEPGSRMYKNRGLIYQMLDDDGRPKGKAIKASSIHFKPTLPFLEEKFGLYKKKDGKDIKRLKNAIDLVLRGRNINFNDFIRLLRDEQIYVVARVNNDRLLYGLTFIDTAVKVAINGSDIGKEYTAKKILEKLGLDQHLHPLSTVAAKSQSKTSKKAGSDRQITIPFPAGSAFHALPVPAEDGLFDILLRSEQEYEQTPDELQRDKKKKKRNQSPNK